VLSLSLTNVEHVIVDGDSTDGTTDFLREYNDKIACWLSEPDKGIYDAMNKAIGFARGSWILFLGADDTLLPGFKDMLVNLTDSSTIYYGDYCYDSQVLGKEFTGYRLSKSNICHQNIFYPRAVFRKYKYNVRYKVSADYFLNIQCWADRQFKFKYFPALIANYASGGFSSTVVDEEFNKDLASNIRKYLGLTVYYRYRFKQFRNKYRRLSAGSGVNTNV